MPRPRIDMYETEDWILRIKGWARDGLTEEQIAYNMGISGKSLQRWKKQSVQIGTALKESKEVADRVVENALYKSACGYDVEEADEIYKNGVLVSRHVKIRHIPASNTAQIFWLKNRKPNEWRDKRIVEDHINFEDDGFINALKEQATETFNGVENIVES